jgi:hypothetical protein
VILFTDTKYGTNIKELNKIHNNKKHMSFSHDAEEGYTRNKMRCSNDGGCVYLPSGMRGA